MIFEYLIDYNHKNGICYYLNRNMINLVGITENSKFKAYALPWSSEIIK